jgi:hypothetical protein
MASRKRPAINGVAPETQPALTRSIDRNPEDRPEEAQTVLPKTETDTPGDDWFDIDNWG